MSVRQLARSTARTPESTVSDEDALIERLGRTLSQGTVVGQATGMLMERLGVDAAAAFAQLSQVALEEGLPAAEIASRLVRTRRLRVSANIRSTARSPGSEHGRPGSRVVAELSPRELEVLTMVAQGATNNEIAAGLYLSLNTVKTYVRTGYRKIGATRRAQAVIWGRQNGLVDSVERPSRP